LASVLMIATRCVSNSGCTLTLISWVYFAYRTTWLSNHWGCIDYAFQVMWKFRTILSSEIYLQIMCRIVNQLFVHTLYYGIMWKQSMDYARSSFFHSYSFRVCSLNRWSSMTLLEWL
jgi:hypothetical protein